MYQNPFSAPRQKRSTVFYERGQPDTMKADCKSGMFLALGQESTITEGKNTVANPNGRTTIIMQPIKYAHLPNAVLFPAEGGERKRITYTQVFFADERGVLTSVLLKGESRDNFLRTVREIEIEGGGEKRFVDFSMTATMNRRKSAKFKSDYYAVEFEASPLSEEALQRNADFAKANYDDVFDSRTIAEYVKQNVPNWEAYEFPIICAELLAAFEFIPPTKVAEIAGGSTPLTVELLTTTNAQPTESAPQPAQ